LCRLHNFIEEGCACLSWFAVDEHRAGATHLLKTSRFPRDGRYPVARGIDG
jgi:hypothetical protein